MPNTYATTTQHIRDPRRNVRYLEHELRMPSQSKNLWRMRELLSANSLRKAGHFKRNCEVALSAGHRTRGQQCIQFKRWFSEFGKLFFACLLKTCPRHHSHVASYSTWLTNMIDILTCECCKTKFWRILILFPS